MKQISDGETTTSSRPAFRGLTAASVMALRFSFAGGWKRLLLSYAPGDFKEASPYTRVVRHLVIDFYDRHPINEAQVLESARTRPGRARGPLDPEDLWAWDQDHYGGLGAVETLARRAAITPGM